jgi:hypothetical protein
LDYLLPFGHHPLPFEAMSVCWQGFSHSIWLLNESIWLLNESGSYSHRLLSNMSNLSSREEILDSASENFDIVSDSGFVTLFVRLMTLG